jgi:hypothetical protein
VTRRQWRQVFESQGRFQLFVEVTDDPIDALDVTLSGLRFHIACPVIRFQVRNTSDYVSGIAADRFNQKSVLNPAKLELRV